MGGKTFAQGSSTELLVESLSEEQRALLSTPIVADSLDAAGARHQVAQASVRPTWSGARLIGRAATIQFVPTEEDETDPYAAFMDFMEALQPGSVPVLAAGGDTRTAYWGELFSAAAIGRRAAGTVIDGPARDLPKIEALRYPIFSTGSRPVDFRARMRVAKQHSIVSFAGVIVAQGDLVLADSDGVVFVPAALEHEVLTRALSRASAETTVLSELVAGASLRQVWQRWGVL